MTEIDQLGATDEHGVPGTDRVYALVSVALTVAWALSVSDRESDVAAIAALLLPFVSLGLGVIGVAFVVRAWRADRDRRLLLIATAIALVPAFALFIFVGLFFGPPAGEDW